MVAVDELKSYLRGMADDEAREACARAVGTSLGHLRNVSYGIRSLDPAACVALEAHSLRVLRRWHLRPHDWHRIWPELVGSEGAPQPAAAQERVA
jgi:hypothetical protein